MNFEQWPKELGKKIHESEFETPIIKPQAEESLKMAREDILDILEKNKAKKTDSEHVEDIFKNIANIISSTSFDQRFVSAGVEVVNKERVRYEMKKLINYIITTQSVEKMENFARVFMDVNGLKPINDFVSHENGDKFLLRAVTILTDNERVQKFADDNNLNIIPSSEGGDEFGYWLEKQDGPVTTDIINDLGDIVKEEVAAMNTDDIFDITDNQLKAKLAKENLKPPAGFKFKPSISFGGLTLLQAYAAMESDKDMSAMATHDEAINILMDYYFRMSEAIADLDKAAKKESLKISSDEHDNFLHKIMQRSVEAREALDKLDQVRKNFISFNEVVKNLIDNILTRKSEILAEMLADDFDVNRKQVLRAEVAVLENSEKQIASFLQNFDLFDTKD